MAAQTRVLCIGHSYMKHFQYFAYSRTTSHLFVNDKNTSLDRFPGPMHNLFLSEDQFSISFDGVGGATVYPPPRSSRRKDKSIRTLFNRSVDFFEPQIVYIQVGSNDVSDSDLSPTELARDIVSYAEYVLNTLHVAFLVIGELVPRAAPSHPAFNDHIRLCNQALKQMLVVFSLYIY